MVATSQPLAAEAGLQILRNGGNAVDAALATAIALTVVEPTCNGIGGDAFAIVWDGNRLHGFNGSGRSPSAWTPDLFSGLNEMPLRGWNSVTTPGAIALWADLSAQFGLLPFANLFEPAVTFASDGFRVTPITAEAWKRAEMAFADFPEFQRTFLPNGKAPAAEEIFSSQAHANSLLDIANSKGESFYRGKLARQLVQASQSDGGSLSAVDLDKHRTLAADPISCRFGEYELHELPPNSQGLAALLAVGILNELGLDVHNCESVESLHLQIEAMKLAFADVNQHLADPDHMTINPDLFLDKEYLRKRAGQINPKEAQQPSTGLTSSGGTVYLTTADASGMMVSFIQSNYYGFGSGVVIPNTGIAMQNRGRGFTLRTGHPNQVGGNKLPYHTIIPAFVTHHGTPVMSLGVMGGHMQPQGHLQMLVRILGYGQSPQAASDAPRWFVTEDNRLALEPGFAPDLLNDLAERGHRLVTDLPTSSFGGAQIIMKTERGYIGASDHRKDGCVVGF